MSNKKNYKKSKKMFDTMKTVCYSKGINIKKESEI